MPRFFLIGIVVLQILIGWNFAGASDELEEPVIVIEKKLLLPDKLLAAINAVFPEFIIPEESDYPAGVFTLDYLFHTVQDSTLPYVCWGDFNGDELTDVVLFLIAEETRLPDYKPHDGDALFVVFHKTKEGYLPQVLLDGKPRLIWFDKVLATLPSQEILTAKGKGYASDPSELDTIHPQFDSIHFQNMESTASIFFYNKDGEYKRVWLSD